jgi:GDP-L-fucose synthase
MITLVTGSEGLVGSAIRSIAPKNFVFAARPDADLRSENETLELFKKVNPDRVIHLAAHVGGIGGNIMHSADFFKDNILINMNVLEAARKSGVKKLISFMSTCVFPNEGPYPLEPANLHLGAAPIQLWLCLRKKNAGSSNKSISRTMGNELSNCNSFQHLWAS